MKKILIATSNPGKRKELLSALLPLEGHIFISPEDLGIDLDVDETGDSYASNALLKAQGFYDLANIPVIAEDSGIEVSALGDELGVFTRRWGAGESASDEEWLKYFMDRMAKEEDRSARFVSHLHYMDEHGSQTFEGECLGDITHDIEGPVHPGIQLSAIFRPVGEEQVYSAMDEEQKNSLSHRGQAALKLREWLSQQND